jgi:glycosyltransferase involved in cell wall biosynthesis
VTLIASMIVKDELHRYLPLTVEHLLTYVDEIRVLDDGSTDGTFEWLRDQEGVEVIRNPGPSFFEHEGEARQNLYRHTLQGLPDYVLAIDADEFVTNPSYLQAAMDGAGAVYTLSLVEAWVVSDRGIDIRVDGLWGPRRIPILYQIVRESHDWRITPRKLACGREPEQVIQLSRRAMATGCEVIHFGWANEDERTARAQRYYDHDNGQFHQNRHLQSILWTDGRVRMRRLPWPPSFSELEPKLMALLNR